jgi:hypothetical protein
MTLLERKMRCREDNLLEKTIRSNLTTPFFHEIYNFPKKNELIFFGKMETLRKMEFLN